MKDLNLFIFRLKHLKGIGNKGLLRLLQYYMEFPEEEVSLNSFIKIGKVKKNYLSIFTDSFEKNKDIKKEKYNEF